MRKECRSWCLLLRCSSRGAFPKFSAILVEGCKGVIRMTRLSHNLALLPITSLRSSSSIRITFQDGQKVLKQKGETKSWKSPTSLSGSRERAVASGKVCRRCRRKRAMNMFYNNTHVELRTKTLASFERFLRHCMKVKDKNKTRELDMFVKMNRKLDVKQKQWFFSQNLWFSLLKIKSTFSALKHVSITNIPRTDFSSLLTLRSFDHWSWQILPLGNKNGVALRGLFEI